MQNPSPQTPTALALRGAGGFFWIESATWERVLGLAQLYGWQPDGPPRPDRRPVDEAIDLGYLFADGQRLSTRDCREIAAALDRALPDVPDHDAQAEDAADTPFTFFSGPGRLWLAALAAFCRAGSFIIRAAPVPADHSTEGRAA